MIKQISNIFNFDTRIIFFMLFPIIYITGPFFTEIFLILLALKTLTNIEQIKKKILEDNKFIQIFFILIFIQGFLHFPDVNYKNLLYVRFYFYYLSVRILIKTKDNEYQNYNVFIRTILYSFLILILFNLFQLTTSFGLIYDRITIPIRQEEIAVSIYSKFYAFILLFLLFSPKNFRNTQFFIKYKYLILTTTILVPIIAIFSGERMNTIMLLCFIVSMIIKYSPLKFLYLVVIITAILLSLKYFEFLNLFERFEYILKRYNTFFDILAGDFFKDSIWGNHYITAFEIFKKNYFFGTGLKTFSIECLNYVEEFKHACTSHPHNIYLEIASETGIIGLISILAILIIVLKGFIIYFFKKELNVSQIFFLALCSCIIIYIFPFRSTGSFFNNYNSSFFWIFYGLFNNFFLKENTN